MCAPARAAGPVILVLGAVLAWVLGPAAALASTGDAVVASSASANGIAPRFGVAPPPDWVVDVEVPDTAGVSDDLLHDGIADLLSDIQVRIGDGPEQRFSRYVSEVVEPSGVSSVGRIQIEFAATYQELEIHWIRLVRDGVVQERLDASDVRIIQQEEDLGLDLYYQNATALVLLDDVRVGDRVDYAYSIVGANPIFGGRYVDWLHLEWWYPFGRIHNRIVAPRDRTLYFELHNTDEGPEIRPVPGHDDLVEHVFVRDDVEAVLSEDETPADHSPLAAHQVSEFETWGEVARWSAETFDHGGEPGDAVRELAAGIREQHETTEEQIIAALRYVQDEVRYLGLEIGVNAYRPHRPALTLERRFGDCKDKSSLLVAILRELGVEAHVALVNTELGPAVADLHPTSDAFDHAIVRVRHDGHAYWLDPTASYERGPLEDEEWFEYGFALVVDANGEALTTVEPHRTTLLRARVVHTYTTVDYAEPTVLEVASTYRGDRADSLRSWVASTPIDSIERQYQNYYARDMPEIELAAPLTIEDDEVTNTIVVTERYRVPGLWDWDSQKERYKARFIARELRDELSTPDTVQRVHPLAVSHPVRSELTIRIDAPERMRVRRVDERIEGPAFTLDYEVRREGGNVVIDYAYTSTADRVEPEDVADHLDAVGEALGTTHYRLGSATSRFGGAGELGAPPFGVAPWLREAITAVVVASFWAFLGLPWLLLRSALRGIERGEVAGAVQRLRVAARGAPLRSVLGRRILLALSVALGLWGRRDEALGHAARLTRLPARSARARTVRAVAWAWRAELAAPLAPDSAERFADQAVDLARELPGVHGWMARTCALSARTRLRARHGALEAAARDLEEARSHRSDEGDRADGWAALLRVVSSTERAAATLERARGDSDAAVRASAEYLRSSERAWPDHHPLVIEARLIHAERLGEAGRSSEAWGELDRAVAGLGDAVDEESPLRARVAGLHDALADRE